MQGLLRGDTWRVPCSPDGSTISSLPTTPSPQSCGGVEFGTGAPSPRLQAGREGTYHREGRWVMESRAMPASLAAWKILPSTSMLTALVHSSRRAYFGLESGSRAGEAVAPPLLLTWSGPDPPPLGAQFLLGPPNRTAFPLRRPRGACILSRRLVSAMGLESSQCLREP